MARESSVAAARSRQASIAKDAARRRAATNIHGRNREDFRHESGVRGDAGKGAFGIHELGGDFERNFRARVVRRERAFA